MTTGRINQVALLLRLDTRHANYKRRPLKDNIHSAQASVSMRPTHSRKHRVQICKWALARAGCRVYPGKMFPCTHRFTGRGYHTDPESQLWRVQQLGTGASPKVQERAQWLSGLSSPCKACTNRRNLGLA